MTKRGRPKGLKLSDETKQQISMKATLHWAQNRNSRMETFSSPEFKSKMSSVTAGKKRAPMAPFSSERREGLRQARIGKKHSDETKQKIKDSWSLRRKRTEKEE